MHRSVEPLARAVAGEHPTGAVGAVRCGREADDDDVRARVAEPGHGPAPVVVVAERRSLLRGDLLAPRDQSWAGPTRDDLCRHGRDRVHQGQGRLTRSAHEPAANRRPRPSWCSSATGRRRPPARSCRAARPACTSSDKGREQAEAVAERLAGAAEGRRRLRLAARAHARDRGADREDSGACGCGSTKGLARGRLRRVDRAGAQGADQAARVADGAALPERLPLPDGESFAEMQTRITGTIDKLVARHPGGVVVAVSHADPDQGGGRPGARHAPRPLPADRDLAVLGDRDRLRPGGPAVLTVNSANGTPRRPEVGCSERVVRPRRRRLCSPPAPSARPASGSSTCRRARTTSSSACEVEKQQVAALGEYLQRMLADLPQPERSLTSSTVDARRAGRGPVGRRLARRRLRRGRRPHPGRGRASCVETDEEDDAGARASTEATARASASPAARRSAFVATRRAAVDGGRPPCPLCGRPLDPTATSARA